VFICHPCSLLSWLWQVWCLVITTPPLSFNCHLVRWKFFSPLFKDPTGASGDAYLDISIQTACVSNLQITVHLPQHYDAAEVSATFEGASFGPRSIAGFSLRANLPSVPTTASVAWDGPTKTLTFTDFVAGGATQPLAGSPGWVNLNFDMPLTTFGNGPNQLPLTLVALGDNPTVLPNPQIALNLNKEDHFRAVNLNPGQRCGDAPPGGSGDPVFSGFQGQHFQFHGLPDEHFNLVSSPDVQVNSHFVYLSSGKCDYNDTECYTHPGTYMDVLGFSVADAHVKVVAGTHAAGLRVWVNDAELQQGAHIGQLSANTTASLKYHHNGRLEINTEVINFEVVNSDMFMNIRAALNSHELLRVGSKKHTVTDAAICKTNSETHNHQLVEQTVSKKYPVTSQLHGLIGQTWRNVKVCGHDWMGTVQDYLVSDLFASDNHYNYFKW